MKLTIYHNPRCSKSRQTLALLEERQVAPVVVKYLESPPTANDILSIAAAVGVTVRDLLRTGEPEYKDNAEFLDQSDEQAIATWLAANPRVLERPIVIDHDSGNAVIGRPPENVLALVES